MNFNLSLLLGLVFIATSSVSDAAEDSKDPKIGFSYNFQIKSDDDGLDKDAGTDQATTSIGIEALFINFSGSPADSFYYSIGINGADTGTTNTGVLDHAELTYTKKKLSILIGNPKANTYGWRYKLDGPLGYTPAASTTNAPWGRAETMQVKYESDFGNYIIQLAKDTITTTSKTKYERTFASTLEWTKTFGTFTPLAQLTKYDSGESQAISLGVKYEINSWDFYFDYTLDNKYTTTRNDTDKITSLNFESYYTTNSYELFFLYGSFDNQQAGTDLKQNTSSSAYDDNQTTLALGTSYLGFHSGFNPYFSYTMDEGEFLNSSSTKEKFKNLIISIGIKGAF